MMLMYPSTRKGLITEPTSVPFQDSVRIQDDHFLPDEASTLHCFQQQHQPRLHSPFQYHPDFQFVSPPSSAPSSPTFSSPSSSIAYPPATAVATDYPAVFDGNTSCEAPSMTPASSYNPSIHIQQSASPHTSQPYLPQYPQHYMIDNASMLAQQPVANSWEGNLQLLGPAHVQNGLQRVSQFQDSQRKPSPSASNRSANNSHRRSNSATVSKPLPTPVQTPVQNSFLAPSFQNYDPSHDGNAQAEAMRRAVIEQQKLQQHQNQSQHQHQHSDYSLAPSVSSLSHNSPVTPQTSFDELDDASKAIANEYGNQTMGIPKLNRTISDIYQDELYNPAIMSTPQMAKQSTAQNLLTPYRNVFADRLQAANQGHMSARSQSPVMPMNRERSPFRHNSPLAGEFSAAGLQQPQMATSVPMSQNTSVNMNSQEPKTMSPKDALLDFNEGEDPSMQPLFPSSQPDFNLGDTLGLRRESSGSFRTGQNFVSMESFPPQYATAGMPQQYPMAQQPQERRSASQQQQQQPQQSSFLHQTPEFPASLPTLESTSSEVLPSTEMASPQLAQPKMAVQPINEGITRPSNTSSDSGTYTCTYHGCTLRFESPSKLQKHKREAHRQTTPGGHLVGRETASRNSQAGPHKCERINPSTGKPCNSVFSRPYDLTRHEDTIHNARKQKVRCHLCTEEKTFSRNDALTRHMRVVHPEVDWPGKQRRRGGRE